MLDTRAVPGASPNCPSATTWPWTLRRHRRPAGGRRQRVEIVKALYRNVDILILDEPTAVLDAAGDRRPL
ncbi:MAG: ATP-binding cassette domain-containing protein [Caldilineaceae bacterium]